MDSIRRLALRSFSAAGLGLAAGGLLRPRSLMAGWGPEAFEATGVRDALTALGITDPVTTDAITIDAPDFAENGAVVPIGVTTSLPGAERIALLIDRNPYPYVARFDITDAASPIVTLRVRFAETSMMRVVVRASGQDHVATREVRVIAGACAGDVPMAEAPRDPGPIKMRARKVGGEADVRVLMEHPMENGLRMDAVGKPIPAHYIRRVVAELNGSEVFEAWFGRSVSTDPLIGFRLREAQAGDRLVVSWEDSRGMSRSAETKIVAG